MRLLLLAPKAFPGVTSALRNLAGVVPGLDLRHIEDVAYYRPRFGSGILGKGYRKLQRTLRTLGVEKVKEYGDNIVLGGWSPLYEILLEKLSKYGVRPSLMWCSSLGQAEMTRTEVRSFVQVLGHLKQKRIRHLLLHRRLFCFFGDVEGAVYLPYAIDLRRTRVTQNRAFEGLNVDLFCPFRYGKNILNQLLAAKLAKSSFTLHINLQVDWLRSVLSEIELDAVVHPWLEEERYWNFLVGMDLSLQVTHTESFNYAVCERMCLGIPVLTTHNIWLVSEDDFLRSHLCVEAPDTPQAIAAKVDRILGSSSLREEVGERCRERIETVAEENNRVAKTTIDSLFSDN